MGLYRITFAGHRIVDDYLLAEEQLTNIISELMITCEFIEFYIGNDGDFDRIAISVIRDLRKNTVSITAP